MIACVGIIIKGRHWYGCEGDYEDCKGLRVCNPDSSKSPSRIFQLSVVFFRNVTNILFVFFWDRIDTKQPDPHWVSVMQTCSNNKKHISGLFLCGCQRQEWAWKRQSTSQGIEFTACSQGGGGLGTIHRRRMHRMCDWKGYQLRTEPCLVLSSYSKQMLGGEPWWKWWGGQ